MSTVQAGIFPVGEKRIFCAEPLTAESLRLDVFLSRQPGLGSRAWIQRLIEQGRVRLNGRPAKAASKVHAQDRIEVDLPEPEPAALQAEPIALSILYEDEHLVVLDKPAGMLVHPYPGRLSGTLVNALLFHCRDLSGIGGRIKPGIVHRLDKLTSGVMVAAKTDAAHQGLARQFKAHTISRAYLALVHGTVARERGTIQSLIGRNPRHRLKMTGRTQQGKMAVTHFQVKARYPGFSLLECRLETGRTHQIRVHLSEAGHPLVGDPLYGKGRALPGKLSLEQRAVLKHFHRQALHAYRLGFVHPITGQPLEFTSAPPADFQALLKILGPSPS